MASDTSSPFAPRGAILEIEFGHTFMPRFDGSGLIPAIVTDAKDGMVLMFAWMNEEALTLSIETGIGHFYSRSRRKLWMKGQESGNVMRITEMRTDCDQDVVWMRVVVDGEHVACHTGARSCFYRTVPIGAGSRPRRLRDAKS
ncbi:MAG: phosphoribosyl-AMP cyclohydrolase [Hyphomicrobiaceae bacterium]|nr:phosphoribosyl-AMP cyclohydrolase [Hyphomicrobiaceae bacterium]